MYYLIDIQSQKNKGTTVKILLPIKKNTKVEKSQKKGEVSYSQNRRKRYTFK